MKVDEAYHVETVVLERSLEEGAVALAQVFEVGVGHKGARHGVVALVSEQAFLDRAQVAALESVPVKGPDQREQVDMGRARKLAWHSRHHPARPQDRQVERAAIERRYRPGLLNLAREGVKEGSLHAGLGQENLRHPKPAIDWCRHSGGKHIGPGTARKSGGLGVDVRDRAGVRVEGGQRNHILAQRGVAERCRHQLKSARQGALGMRAPNRRRA